MIGLRKKAFGDEIAAVLAGMGGVNFISLLGETDAVLNEGVTFTRGSTATYFDANRQLQTAAVNQPRYDFDPDTGLFRGLLLEEARTNLFLNSLTPATQNIAVTYQYYTLSFFGSGSIEISGSHAATLVGAGVNRRVALRFRPAAGTLTLTVSGSVQMAQLEAGNCPTSIIVTGGSAVTRQMDLAVCHTLSTTFPFDQGNFSLYAELETQNLPGISLGSRNILRMQTSSTVGTSQVWFDYIHSSLVARRVVANSLETDSKVSHSLPHIKSLGSFSVASGTFVASPSLQSTSSAAQPFTTSLEYMRIGDNYYNSGAVNGWFRRLRIYDGALSSFGDA